MFKNISKSKIVLAVISIIITFFVWQQGLKESLNRPSVSFDISQKEIEIIELAKPAIPEKLKKFFPDDSYKEMENSLSKLSFSELSDRNKLIWLLISNNEKIDNEIFNQFEAPIYKNTALNIQKIYLDKSFSKTFKISEDFKKDKYLYRLICKKLHLDDTDINTKRNANVMFLKIIVIRLIPILSILIGSILVIRSIISIISSKTIQWKEFQPLDLNLIDMILLISGGFVVLGEVVSPLFSITLVEIFSKKLSPEISQSLKIFFGYFFMSIPPLLILYNQIKTIDNEFIFKKDYFQFNFYPIYKSLIFGFKGWVMIIPFVFLTSLITNLFIDNKVGSNPLLEIVLNNNNFLAFILLFITTTIFAPLFEEIIFRGVLLPILSRDFGKIIGIILSSFIFALAHLSFSELPPLFILGIGLSLTRFISGRLFSSVVMHSLWNGLTFLNLFLLRT